MSTKMGNTNIPLRDELANALAAAEAIDSDSVEAATLRLIRCAVEDRDFTARERGECSGCPETAMQDLLKTMAAQRKESAREYDEAGRIEEAERERKELEIIQRFLPAKLEGDQLNAAVEEVVEELEATKLKDLGRCMKALKMRYPGQIETGTAGKAVRAALG
ncbi:MAG: GatB/YqeY domain-containing protein [Pseudomonadota bacterium]